MPQKPQELTRDFKITDDAMIEDSNTTLALFISDKAAFVNFDKNTFDDPFAADWQTAITASENADTDEQYLDQQQGKSTTVDDTMLACRNKYGTTKYFVLKAFPDNIAVQNEFGLDDYDDARDSQTRLRKFMITMNKTANKYKTELGAVGFDQAAIDEILALGQSLEDSDTDQETFIKGRGVATQTRIILHNTTWGFRTKVAEAAKIIYANNFAKYQQYLLPPSEAAPADVSITGAITDEDTSAPLPGAEWQIGSIGLSGNSDEFGVYAVGIITAGDYSIELKRITILRKLFLSPWAMRLLLH